MPDLTVWPTDSPSDGSVSSEARWRKMARLWVPSGVNPGGLTVALIAGPAITVQPGAAWLDGHYAELTTVQTVPVTANGLLVLRFTAADNRCELLYRDGASLTPTRTDPTWELPLASMYAGAIYDHRYGTVPSGAPIVGALPAYPFDGQEVVYWDATSGRGWHMTYFAAAPAPYRWVVTGGPPLFAIIGTNENQAVGPQADLPTVGPQVIVPLAGIYDVQCGFNGNNTGAGCVQTMIVVNMGTGAQLAAAIQSNPGAAAASNMTVASALNAYTITGPATPLRGRYNTSGSAGYYGARWLTARPIRVG